MVKVKMVGFAVSKGRLVFLGIAIMMLLSACAFSLAEDITPPPDYEVVLPTQMAALTPLPAAEIPKEGPASTEPQAVGTPSTSATLKAITGRVINASSGQIPSDLTVTLHGFKNAEEIITKQTIPEVNGSFAFHGVDLKNEYLYIATVDFEGVTYYSDIGAVDGGVDTLELPVTIYETTTDTAVLVVDRLHIICEPVSYDTLRIAHLYIISNMSNKTLVAQAPDAPLVFFELPPDATNLQFQEGKLNERFVKTSSGFADTLPVRPGVGTYQVLYAFDLPLEKQVEISEKSHFRINTLIIMFPLKGLKFIAGDFREAGIRKIQGDDYQTLVGENLMTGEYLSFTISRQGGVSALINFVTQPSSRSFLAISLGLLGVVLVIIGLTLYRRRQQIIAVTSPARTGDFFAGGIENNLIDANALMDAIIALDDLFASGEIAETAYQERRVQLKEQLSEVIKSNQKKIPEK